MAFLIHFSVFSFGETLIQFLRVISFLLRVEDSRKSTANMSGYVGVIVSDPWLQSQFTQVELRGLKSKVRIFSILWILISFYQFWEDYPSIGNFWVTYGMRAFEVSLRKESIRSTNG